jgi:hypothetical protein
VKIDDFAALNTGAPLSREDIKQLSARMAVPVGDDTGADNCAHGCIFAVNGALQKGLYLKRAGRNAVWRSDDIGVGATNCHMFGHAMVLSAQRIFFGHF